VASDEEILDWVAKDAETALHPSCTCRMGTDDMSVVDPLSMRVRGVEGLRVVDASVFPRIPGFFIVTAIYMAAEKASAAILTVAATAAPAPAPSRTDLRSVLARLPRPRKPARTSAVQEIR
jgi:choline dehydrogenase